MLVLNFFQDTYEIINNWMKNTFKFDEIIDNFYQTIIAPLPEIVKMLGLVVILFLLVIGVVGFVKKFVKTFIAIAIIAVIIVVLKILF